jgi:hypothetical protein
MSKYNIVTNLKILEIFRSGSKHYKVNLGMASTVDGNSGRVMNDRDKFAYFYNQRYRTTIHSKGTIGNIQFYQDYYLQQDLIAFYFEEEEYIFELDEKLIKEKGVDFYLGHLLKRIDNEVQFKKQKNEEEKVSVEKKGDANKILTNPGSISYDDVKAFLEKQRLERFNK